MPSPERIESAAKAATLHDDIMAMPMGYDSLVGDMGSTLSGGQKQRVFLARAFYREPSLLVIDEGTSHLDSERERAVNRAIAEFGVTRIIIAHRLETIAQAGKVYRVEATHLSECEPGAFRERREAAD